MAVFKDRLSGCTKWMSWWFQISTQNTVSRMFLQIQRILCTLGKMARLLAGKERLQWQKGPYATTKPLYGRATEMEVSKNESCQMKNLERKSTGFISNETVINMLSYEATEIVENRTQWHRHIKHDKKCLELVNCGDEVQILNDYANWRSKFITLF